MGGGKCFYGFKNGYFKNIYSDNIYKNMKNKKRRKSKNNKKKYYSLMSSHDSKKYNIKKEAFFVKYFDSPLYSE